MDPVFSVMLDVVRIATFQPHAANTATRRIERDRAIASTDAPAAKESATALAREAMWALPKWLTLSFTPR
jgi:hypothetical protein